MLDPEEYRRRAHDCRDKAEQVSDDAKTEWIEAAAIWDLLAQQVAFHIRNKRPG